VVHIRPVLWPACRPPLTIYPSIDLIYYQFVYQSGFHKFRIVLLLFYLRFFMIFIRGWRGQDFQYLFYLIFLRRLTWSKIYCCVGWDSDLGSRDCSIVGCLRAIWVLGPRSIYDQWWVLEYCWHTSTGYSVLVISVMWFWEEIQFGSPIRWKILDCTCMVD
jgi:hypothetical protein